MRIAITSTGYSPDSLLDGRFGRCAFFVFYDTETRSTEFVPNAAKDADGGAGPIAVQLIASRDVAKVVSGEFGIKAKPLLDSLKIQMIVVKDTGMKIRDIIEMLNQKND